MTRFTWDQTEVLSCLGVEPVVDEEEVSLHYEVQTEDCGLQLTLYADSNPSVSFKLTRRAGEVPYVSLWMEGVAEIRSRRDGKIEELAFVPSQDPEAPSTIAYGFILRVSPALGVRFGTPEEPVTALFPPK